MANVLNWLRQTNKPGRNGYDVSRRNTFSMPCAMMIPCLVRDFPMDTDNDISLDSIINTTPLVNQPFTRGQFVVDFYQVPYSMLYSNFNQFYTQTNEVFSSAADLTQVLNNVPQLNLSILLYYLAHDYYVFQSRENNDSFDVPFMNRGQAVFSTLGLDVHGFPRCYGAIRLLDMLGYGNFLPFIKWVALKVDAVEDPISLGLSDAKWYDKYRNPVAFAAVVVGLYHYYVRGIWRDTNNILNFGFNHMNDSQSSFDECLHEFENDGDYFVKINPLRLQAYQKIFQDIYINTFYETPSPVSYSSDLIDNGNTEYFMGLYDHPASIGDEFPVRMYLPNSWLLIEIHYRQFKKDMFTSLLPNSQLGDVAITPVGNDDVVSIAGLAQNLRATVRVESDGTLKTSIPSPSGSTSFSINGLSFTVLQNRRAEAVQKYKERYLRAGNRVKDQFKSSWGIVPYYLEDHYCRYLGTMSSSLNLQAVPATNDTGNYNIGERASYGYSQIKDKISFNSKDFGLVMAVCYFLPEMDYPAYGLETPNKAQEYLDYPIPEFENLGLVGVTRTDLNQFGSYNSLLEAAYNPDGVINDRPLVGDDFVGFGPAYLYYKTDVDKLHGEFCNYYDVYGIFSSWVTSRGQVSMRYLSDYYCDPTYLNPIFVSQFNGMQSSDQFLMCLNFDFKVVEGLSVIGLPVWD